MAGGFALNPVSVSFSFSNCFLHYKHDQHCVGLTIVNIFCSFCFVHIYNFYCKQSVLSFGQVSSGEAHYELNGVT